MAETVEVKVGQVWADCDKRMKRAGRQVKVVRTLTSESDPRMNHAVVVSRRGSEPWGRKETRVRLERFRPGSTGYRLVHDGEYVQ